MTLQAIDLFCGGGGISAGLRMAGFEVVAGVDIEKTYISTFKHNFPEAIAVTDSVTNITPKELGDRVGIRPEQLDILTGGPPCQGFSKNVPRKHRHLDDPKNLLVKSFLDYAEYLRPRIVLMENVAEMKNGFDGQYTEEVASRLMAAGYSVTYAVLNAADYGVPQRRRRAFFMANRDGVNFTIPRATHFALADTPSLLQRTAYVSVWDAIGDLPPLAHGEGEEITTYAFSAQGDFQRKVRNPSGGVRNHIAKRLAPTQLARLAALEPGQGHKDLPLHLQVKSGYSGAYGRLTKEMTAPTITRWVFHPGSGRFGHPVDTRVLSIREVARVQGFPDSYEFVGTYTQQAGQLGNAVPPILAETLIRDLWSQLAHQSSSSNAVRRSSDTFSPAEGLRKAVA